MHISTIIDLKDQILLICNFPDGTRDLFRCNDRYEIISSNKTILAQISIYSFFGIIPS